MHALRSSAFTQRSGFSAKSRVRGHLEIYHAYLYDGTAAPIAAIEEPLNVNEWEIVGDGREETASQVSVLYFTGFIDFLYQLYVLL